MSEHSTVTLVGLPVALCSQAIQHYEAIFRELRLISLATPDERKDLPPRLIVVASALGDADLRVRSGNVEQLEAAARRGEASRDVPLALPPDAVERGRELARLLAELDDFCDRGDLLTLVPPRELLDFRTWVLEEIERQSEGEPPVPWPDYQRTRLSPEADPTP